MQVDCGLVDDKLSIQSGLYVCVRMCEGGKGKI